MGKECGTTLSSIQDTIARSDSEAALLKTFDEKLSKILDELAREPKLLAGVFAAVELHATSRAAEDIATHVMRPEDVTVMVANRKAAIEAEKVELKAQRAAKKLKKDGSAD